MNKENTAKLFQHFHELFRDSNQSCMQRGFETGDGWFNLIYQLCQNIKEVALQAGISRCSDDWPRVEQVKSKFGQLRFYILNHKPGVANTHMEAIQKLIDDAVVESAAICEECGSPGALRQFNTLCNTCMEIRVIKGCEMST